MYLRVPLRLKISVDVSNERDFKSNKFSKN